jgi:aldose sugar dehydrogenase
MAFTEARGGGTVTAVFRARLNEAQTALENGQTIFRQNIVGQENSHYGSRLVFDPSEHLFVTTGDRQSWQDRGLRGEVQKPDTFIGKIIRITRDGTAAPGNPNLSGWAKEIWSTGHRNPQGATLHPQTRQLWIADHGPRGGDEINLVQAGKNYGWHLSRLTLANGKVSAEEKLFNGFARFRDVVQGPDGRLYVLTDEGKPGGGLYVITAPPG